MSKVPELEMTMKNELKLNIRFEDFINQKAHSLNDTYIALLDGERMKTIKDMYDEFESVLQIPYYFGGNWNALDECLQDLSWLNKNKYIIAINHYEKILCSYESNSVYTVNDELFCLDDCLKSAIEKWNGAMEIYIQENNFVYQLLNN